MKTENVVIQLYVHFSQGHLNQGVECFKIDEVVGFNI